MRLEQLLILAKLRGVQFWSSVNVYVHQETKGGLFTRSTLPSGQLQSFSPNHSVDETADHFNLLKIETDRLASLLHFVAKEQLQFLKTYHSNYY